MSSKTIFLSWWIVVISSNLMYLTFMLHIPQGSTSIQFFWVSNHSSRSHSKPDLLYRFAPPKVFSLCHHSQAPRLFSALNFLHFLPVSMDISDWLGKVLLKEKKRGGMYLSCLEKSSLSSSSSQLSSQRCVLVPFAFDPWPCSVSSCGQSSHPKVSSLYPAIKRLIPKLWCS